MIIINKNEMMEILKKMAKTAIKIVLIILVAIIVLAAAVKEIKIKDAESLYKDLNATREDIKITKVSPRYAEVKKNIYTDVKMVAQQIKSESYISADGSINIDLEAELQEKIEKLEERNILHTYIKEENLNKYLMAFIKAEFITQYPDLRSADKIGTATASNEFQGCIQIHRALSDGTTKTLTYIPKSEFESYISSNDMKVTDHFSLDSEGNLIVAGWTRITTNVTSNVPDVEKIVDQVEYELTTNSINYKSLVEVYTMPFDLLWTLTVMGEDEDFTYKLAQLALNSEIIFTVQDNITTSITENIEEYETQEKNEKSAWIKLIKEDETMAKEVTKTAEKNPVSYKTETIIKTETCATNIDMTYADTWIVKYENSFSNTIPDSVPGEPEVEEIADTQYELINETTLSSDSEIEQEMLNYKIEKYGSEEEYIKEEEAGNVSAEISTIYYRTYSRTINKKLTNSTSISSNIYVQGTPTVTEKTNKKSSEENFVKLFVNSGKAKSNILSTTEWLFEALEKSPKAADMIDMIKYLLHKATNNDYGIVEYDFGMFGPSQFTTIGGIYGNTIEEKVWYALRGEGYSKEAVAGVMGNIHAESSFDPAVIEKGSGIGFGLCQWSFGRRTQLEAYAASKGVNASDVDTQIEFLLTELNRGVGPAQGYATNQILTNKGYTREMWENATTPEAAATAFCWIFERPSSPNMTRRTEKAREYYESFKNIESGGYYKSIKSGEIVGEYTDSTGRIFTIFNQCNIDGWSKRCNRAAQISVCSGFYTGDAKSLIDIVTSLAPRDLNLYNNVGLKYQNANNEIENHTYSVAKIKAQVLSGKRVVLYLRGSNQGCNGTSKNGVKWAGSAHWVAILGYREIDGREEIFVSDSGWGNTGWWTIDEFDGMVESVVLVNEK